MTPRVVVVGGGAIGASIAWRLARRGATVRLIEDRTRDGVATPAAGGMLAPLAEAQRPGPFLELGLDSLHRYPEFVAALEQQTGLAVGYSRAGKLAVALTPAEEDDLAAAHAWQSTAVEAHVERLTGAQARALEPALAAQVRAALLIRDDHRIDSTALGIALAQAARAAGAQWTDGRVRGLLTEGGRLGGVETVDGRRIEADVVVLAAGAWSGTVEGLPRELPIRPVRGQILALRPARPLFGRTLAGAHGYLVPRLDGRVIVGSTMEDVGFTPTTTPDGLAALRAAASRLVPGLAEAARAGAWAGLRPASPDGLPVLGREPLLDGLIYATGHFRNGILLAPVTAELISELVLGRTIIDVSPFSPVRFESDATGTMEEARARAATPVEEVAPTVAADRLCDLCGAPMYEVHCKLICPACGYKRDCTDLW